MLRVGPASCQHGTCGLRQGIVANRDVFRALRTLPGSVQPGLAHVGIPRRVVARGRVESRDLLLGDLMCLWTFCVYKQVSGVVADPAFPGWTAPIDIQPQHVAEFLSYSSSTVLTWFFVCLLLGGYRASTTASLDEAVRKVVAVWSIQQPVCIAHMLLAVAVENGRLVSDLSGPLYLPFAMRGPLEPVTGAVGILGLMCAWRGLYHAFYERWSAMEEGDMLRAQGAYRQAVGVSLALAGAFEAGLLALQADPAATLAFLQL